ncbi:MAG: hypothetical protein IT467_03935, partial [Dokdonella sp.]|nr:hypothetical protein [Dokdonella sp.]
MLGLAPHDKGVARAGATTRGREVTGRRSEGGATFLRIAITAGKQELVRGDTRIERTDRLIDRTEMNQGSRNDRIALAIGSERAHGQTVRSIGCRVGSSNVPANAVFDDRIHIGRGDLD